MTELFFVAYNVVTDSTAKYFEGGASSIRLYWWIGIELREACAMLKAFQFTICQIQIQQTQKHGTLKIYCYPNFP